MSDLSISKNKILIWIQCQSFRKQLAKKVLTILFLFLFFSRNNQIKREQRDRINEHVIIFTLSICAVKTVNYTVFGHYVRTFFPHIHRHSTKFKCLNIFIPFFCNCNQPKLVQLITFYCPIQWLILWWCFVYVIPGKKDVNWHVRSDWIITLVFSFRFIS